MADHLPRVNEIVAPLSRLTGKVSWHWSDSCQYSFDLLKSLVPEVLVPLNLSTLRDESERLYLFTDASMFGCGGWLGQGKTREQARPFKFFSTKFNSAQRNYTTTDQELLAVFTGCRKMHEHLVGWSFVVVCDHEPLKTYWSQPTKQTRRHVRLWESLSQYDFRWDFIPGKSDNLADSLSRLSELDGTDGVDLQETNEPLPSHDDNVPFPIELVATNRMALACLGSFSTPPLASTSVQSFHLSALLPESANPELTSALPESLLADIRSSLLVNTIGKKVLANPSSFPAFSVVEDLVWLAGPDGWRLVVPSGLFSSSPSTPHPSLREWVIEHAHLTSGHMGPAKTLAVIRRSFWWSSIHADVYSYVRSCEPCARGKSTTTSPFGLLHPLSTPSRPFEKIGMDFVVGLPPMPFGGKAIDSILSVTCYLSKLVILVPLPSTATASEVAKAFVASVFRRFGLPNSIVSDRDSKFTSAFWRSLHNRLGIKLKMSTSAHPQTDGQAEASNKSIGQTLRILCEDASDSWLDAVPHVEFALNTTPSSSTSLPPFSVVHGFSPTSFPPLWPPGATLDSDSFAERSRLNCLRATDAIIASRVAMVAEANKHRQEDAPSFSVGKMAYVATSGMRLPKGIASKFVPRYIGPYPIKKASPSTSNYTLTLPPHLHIHPTFHASRLRPHLPNDDTLFPSRSLSKPPPVVPAVDGADPEYEVEKIVENRVRRNKVQYKVRWLVYSAAEDQWMDALELGKTAPEVVKTYKALKRLRSTTTASLSTSLPSNCGGVSVRTTNRFDLLDVEGTS
ncbi:hypothetical protein JCM16303_003244 [Sporobolomyces ruberrimus]